MSALTILQFLSESVLQGRDLTPYEEVLKKRIKVPGTKRTVFVATALKNKKHKAYPEAARLVQGLEKSSEKKTAGIENKQLTEVDLANLRFDDISPYYEYEGVGVLNHVKYRKQKMAALDKEGKERYFTVTVSRRPPQKEELKIQLWRLMKSKQAHKIGNAYQKWRNKVSALEQELRKAADTSGFRDDVKVVKGLLTPKQLDLDKALLKDNVLNYGAWFESIFTADSDGYTFVPGDYSKKQLVDFVTGKIKKPEVLVNPKWATGLRNAGAVADDGTTILWDNLKKNYQAFEKSKSDAPGSPQAAQDQVAKIKAAWVDRDVGALEALFKSKTTTVQVAKTVAAELGYSWKGSIKATARFFVTNAEESRKQRIRH